MYLIHNLFQDKRIHFQGWFILCVNSKDPRYPTQTRISDFDKHKEGRLISEASVSLSPRFAVTTSDLTLYSVFIESQQNLVWKRLLKPIYFNHPLSNEWRLHQATSGHIFSQIRVLILLEDVHPSQYFCYTTLLFTYAFSFFFLSLL